MRSLILFFLLFSNVMNAADLVGNTRHLCEAAKEGRTADVQSLLEKKANINGSIERGYTPLMLASTRGHIDVVRCLLAAKADINESDGSCYTALMDAAGNGHLYVVQVLVSNGASLNPPHGRFYVTPLNLALYCGHPDVAMFLLKAKANVNEYKQSPLAYACEKGYEEIAKHLITEGANLSGRNREGNTPLSAAASCGHLNLVEILLNQKASVNLVAHDIYRNTPLILASTKGYTLIVKRLLEVEGIEVNQTNLDSEVDRDGRLHGKTALSFAVKEGHVEAVRALLGAGARQDGTRPLLCAMEDGNLDIVKLLLEAKANVNRFEEYQRYENERSPLGKVRWWDKDYLCRAARKGDEKAVRAELRALPHFQGYLRNRALFWAMSNGHDGVVTLLVAAKANIKPFDNIKKTGLLPKAKEWDEVDLLEILKEHGAIEKPSCAIS